ncbi:MAG: DUF4149 domain-containing protein [Gemmatimonadaceae bacterium]
MDRALVSIPVSTLAALALLSAWIGAAIFVAAVVAPAAFAVLPSRTLAGALVGRVLPVLFLSGTLIGVASAAITWQLPGRAGRSIGALILVVACGAAQFVVAPRIERIRAAIAGPMDALAPGDARRVAFGRLHGVSVGLLAVAALAALVTVALLIFTSESNHDG